MARNNIIILDFETGGLDEQKNPITQVGLMVCEPSTFAILETYETFVQPYNNLVITQDALERSRVTMAQINGGVNYKIMFAALVKIIKKYTITGGKIVTKPILAGHNAGFDRRFAKYLFKLFAKDLFDYIEDFFYDTLPMIKAHEMNIKGSEKFANRLDIICERYGIELKSAHGAMNDVIATRLILMMLMSKFKATKTEKGQKIITNAQEEQVKSRKFFELP